LPRHAFDREYEPSPTAWVSEQVELYESSGGTQGTTLRGLPVIILTTRGAKSGKIRKTPLMRVEHDGRYAAVASLGGAPQHPVWYHNVVAEPAGRAAGRPRQARHGRARGHRRGEGALVGASGRRLPDYADYQRKTEREIPVFVVEPDDR
jgi:deazaflavin-dependent oxidoreductase (nitroreductase family)